jgi:hypothetical protein
MPLAMSMRGTMRRRGLQRGAWMMRNSLGEMEIRRSSIFGAEDDGDRSADGENGTEHVH